METTTTVTSSSPLSATHQESSHYDELFMQQSLLFSDSLKDLKNLRKQLYSAAEYFEQAYTKDDRKLLVIDTLKDYVVKALINTVDHLGSVAFKVESLFDERNGEVPGHEFRLSCLEQRIRTCQEFVDRDGLFQQSLVIKTPEHHKRYILPDTMPAARQAAIKFHGCNLSAEDDVPRFPNAAQATISGTPPPVARRRHFQSPLVQSSTSPGIFSFIRNASNKDLEKRMVSQQHFLQMRSGSVVNRSPSSTYYIDKKRYPSEPRRSVSLATRTERERTKEIEQYASKSKRLFKALLSMRKPKKDGTVYKYLDKN